MGCNYFKTSKISLYKITLEGFGSILGLVTTLEYICKSYNMGEHSLKTHSMWIESEDEYNDVRTITCKCDTCLS